MEFELARHDWARLRSFGDSARLPDALRDLARAVDNEAAESAYWRIDGVALVDGCLTEAAAAVTPVVVQVLPRLSQSALPLALELLAQIAGGYVPEPADQGLGPVRLEDCVRDICLAFPFFCELLETAEDPQVRSSCVDLITACGSHDQNLRSRARHTLASALQLPDIDPYRELTLNSPAEH